MIEFKIIACPDKSQQATYQHLGNSLSFGQTEGDMLIDDPTLGALQAKISLQGDQFLLENLSMDVEVRLNGRAVTQPVTIKEKDSLNMGRTTISFSRLDLRSFLAPEPFQYPHAATRFTEGSKEKAILDALEFQEKNETDTAPPVPGALPPLPAGMPKPPIPPMSGASPPLPPGAPPPPRKT